MGGTQSSASQTAITKIANNAATNTIMNCTSTASQEQMMTITTSGWLSVGGGASQTQGTAVNMSCVMNTSTQNQIASSVAAAVGQYASAQGPGVLAALGASSSNVSSMIQNDITTNITTNTQQEMTNNLSQKQSMNVNSSTGISIGVNYTQAQTASIIASALMQTTAYNSALTKVAMAVDQKSTAVTTNPISDVIDSIGKAISSIISTPFLIMGIAAIVIIIIIVVLYKFVF